MSTVEGGGNIVTDGLVLYLDAANPKSYISGSSICFDLISNNITGSLISGSYFTSSNGGTFIFDGVDDYIGNIGDLSVFNFIQNTHVFSISFWMKTFDYNILYYPVGNTPTSGEKGFFISKNANNSFSLFTFRGTSQTTSSINYTSATGLLSDNIWHNYTFTANQNNTLISLYKDGIKISSGSGIGNWITSSGNSSRDLNIGRINNYIPNKLSGSIANFLIYNKTLNDSEVLQNYNAIKSRFGL